MLRQIVRHVDTACYRLEEPTSSADTALDLSHLNPVIRAMNLPDRKVEMKRAHRLCVPIGKGQEQIPDIVRERVEWIDFLQYIITPQTAVDVGPFQAPIPLWLHHMNPLFVEQPPFFVALTPTLNLMVPVAKDDTLPPQD